MSDLVDSEGLFHRVFRDNKNRKFLVDDLDREVKYDEVFSLAESNHFAGTKRRLVLCIIGNDIDGIKGYFSLFLSGAVLILVSEDISPERLLNLMNEFRPSYIWAPVAVSDCFENTVILLSERNYCLKKLPDSDCLEINPNLRLMLSTSGSTGSTKMVRLSEKNVVANGVSIASYLRLSFADRPITVLPPSYSFGLSILHSHALVGATVYVSKKTFFDKSFWEFANRYSITSISGVPYHFEMLNRLKFFSIRPPSINTITQAGGRLSEPLAKFFAHECIENNISFYMMYGQTEATARISFLPPEKAIRKTGSVGAAIPGGELRLVDEFGSTILTPETPGELVYSGPNVCLGYALKAADLAKGDENLGLLKTGDIAYRDLDGDLFIVGRKSRFLKIFGHRIGFDEIDTALERFGVIGVSTGKDDRLEIYLEQASAEMALDVRRKIHALANVPLKAINIYSVDRLPRSQSGKISLSDLTSDTGVRVA